MIGVANHQFKGPHQRGIVQIPNHKAVSGDKIHQPLRADAARIEQMKSFGKHRNRGAKGFFDARKPLRATQMIAVSGVKQGDQRPGIDQDHRLCFRRIMSPIADLAARAGATA